MELNAETPWWVHRAMRDTTPMRTHFVTGGLGSGKSHGGGIWDLQRVRQNAAPVTDPQPTRSWTVGPNYRICETLLELTLQVAQDVFGMRQGTHFELARSFPRVLDFSPAGLNHRLMFLSAANPEHFVSASITHWRWSEVGVSKAEVYEKLSDRLRDKRAKVLQGLGEGTPEGMNHYADLANIPGTTRDRLDLPRNRRRFIVETGDNIGNLAPGYLEALRARYAHDAAKLVSYEKGLFVPLTKSTAYWEWAESKLLIDNIDADPHLPLQLCFDFNKNPMSWIVCQRRWLQRHHYAPRTQQDVAIDETAGTAKGLLDAVAEFAAKFPAGLYRRTLIEIDGDVSGWAGSHKVDGSDYQRIESYLHDLGYERVEVRVQRHTSNPRVKHRLELVAALMAYEQHAVCARCRNLANSYAKTALVPGTWDIDKPHDDTWTHYADACGYYLYRANKDRDVVNPNARPVLGIG